LDEVDEHRPPDAQPRLAPVVAQHRQDRGALLERLAIDGAAREQPLQEFFDAPISGWLLTANIRGMPSESRAISSIVRASPGPSLEGDDSKAIAVAPARE